MNTLHHPSHLQTQRVSAKLLSLTLPSSVAKSVHICRQSENEPLNHVTWILSTNPNLKQGGLTLLWGFLQTYLGHFSQTKNNNNINKKSIKLIEFCLTNFSLINSQLPSVIAKVIWERKMLINRYKEDMEKITLSEKQNISHNCCHDLIHLDKAHKRE